MTATEELRHLLDERGVEHYDRFDVTEWVGSDGEICHTSAIYSNGAAVLVLRKCTTPEQAIAATLEPETCSLSEVETDGYYDAIEYMQIQDWVKDVVYKCDCGTTFGYVANERPRFCPYCGKRVVEEDE